MIIINLITPLSVNWHKTGRVLGIGLACDVQIVAVDIDRGQVTLGWPQGVDLPNEQ